MGWCSQSFYDEIAAKKKKKELSPELICPECGHHPLALVGKDTLCMPTDRKAYCEECTYEEVF